MERRYRKIDMGIFDLFRRKDINEGLVQFKNTKGAILVDVREKDEYRSGHIPGSKNIPLSTLNIIEKQVKDKKTPLYIYCLSGSRSAQATRMLVKMGYEIVNDIGGISGYTGKIEY